MLPVRRERAPGGHRLRQRARHRRTCRTAGPSPAAPSGRSMTVQPDLSDEPERHARAGNRLPISPCGERFRRPRSEEHTSELQSLMRISYAVFCLKKKKNNKSQPTITSKSINIHTLTTSHTLLHDAKRTTHKPHY